jgi:hypothetical protein
MIEKGVQRFSEKIMRKQNPVPGEWNYHAGYAL